MQSGIKLKDHAKKFGMSAGTLESMVAGGGLSDNMLGRIRSALSREVSVAKDKMIFEGDWHNATADKVAQEISTVSQKLVFLKKVVETSNFLKSEDSPIDRIQVLQLIALLTATIEALRAPFVDKKQTKGFFKWLGSLTKTSIEKGAEKLVTDAMTDAVEAGKDLVQKLSTEVGIDDLGNLLSG